MVKNAPASAETQVPTLSREDPLEEEMAPHSSTFAGIIPWSGGWWATVHGLAKESDLATKQQQQCGYCFLLIPETIQCSAAPQQLAAVSV